MDKDELNLYGDLSDEPIFAGNPHTLASSGIGASSIRAELEELRARFDRQSEEYQQDKERLELLEIENQELREQNETLLNNISILYNTAKMETERKNDEVAEMRREMKQLQQQGLSHSGSGMGRTPAGGGGGGGGGRGSQVPSSTHPPRIPPPPSQPPSRSHHTPSSSHPPPPPPPPHHQHRNNHPYTGQEGYPGVTSGAALELMEEWHEGHERVHEGGRWGGGYMGRGGGKGGRGGGYGGGGRGGGDHRPPSRGRYSQAPSEATSPLPPGR